MTLHAHSSIVPCDDSHDIPTMSCDFVKIADLENRDKDAIIGERWREKKNRSRCSAVGHNTHGMSIQCFSASQPPIPLSELSYFQTKLDFQSSHRDLIGSTLTLQNASDHFLTSVCSSLLDHNPELLSAWHEQVRSDSWSDSVCCRVNEERKTAPRQLWSLICLLFHRTKKGGWSRTAKRLNSPSWCLALQLI